MFAICPHCQKETLITVEPVYEGLRKVGECRHCAACGGALPAESGRAAPASSSSSSADPLAALFGGDAAPEPPELFDVEAETGRMCRKCAHYVLHPFTQRCALHDREVQATDSCDRFERKPRA